MSVAASARGRCLCGAVQYEVRGPLREALVCHCEACRRWHGHAPAFTAVARRDLVLLADGALRWYGGADSDAGARRGFCSRCGTSLFWESPRRDTISIAAGTLEPPTGLQIEGHIYVSDAGDYYRLPDDGLPRFPRGS
jgi:hypothetical protein